MDAVVFRSTRYDPVARRRVPQTVTLLTNSRYGLPTPADEDVFVVFLYIAKKANNYTDPVVPFTPRQLFRVMGWAPNSRSYLRLRNVLRRLKGLTIQFDNAWWDAEGRQFHREFATGVIANYGLDRQVAGPDAPEHAHPQWWFEWNPLLFRSLAAGGVKGLDLELLFSLKLPSARRMFRFLDKRFYHRPTVTFDLRDFACGHVGLSEAYDTGQLKSKLKPGLRELEEKTVIEPAGAQERYTKLKPGTWQITFHRARQRAEEVLPAPVGPHGLTSELTARGITPAAAAEIVTTHSRQHIAAKLDVFDWLVRKKDKKVSQNPAGYLVQSIRDDYQPPKGFLPQAEREQGEWERAERQKQQAEAERQREARREARRRAERAPVDAYLAALTGAQRRQLEAEALRQATGFLAERVSQGNGRFAEAARRHIIEDYVKKLLPEQGSEVDSQLA